MGMRNVYFDAKGGFSSFMQSAANMAGKVVTKKGKKSQGKLFEELEIFRRKVLDEEMTPEQEAKHDNETAAYLQELYKLVPKISKEESDRHVLALNDAISDILGGNATTGLLDMWLMTPEHLLQVDAIGVSRNPNLSPTKGNRL